MMGQAEELSLALYLAAKSVEELHHKAVLWEGLFGHIGDDLRRGHKSRTGQKTA